MLTAILLLLVSPFVAVIIGVHLMVRVTLFGVLTDVSQVRRLHLDVLLVLERKQVGARSNTLRGIEVLVAFSQRVLLGNSLVTRSHGVDTTQLVS